MEFTYATPALLFPTISLLFISYTNRFVSYANLIRNLHDRWRDDKSSVVKEQIENLRGRIVMIRTMQLTGAVSLVLCVICMFLLFLGHVVAAEIVFAAALVFLTVSLSILILEVFISVRALNLQLMDMEGE